MIHALRRIGASVVIAGIATSSTIAVARVADPETTWTHGVVAADHPIASAAGLAMLQQGGNAVDAAVATSFCLSVVRPYSCGIGGGGFMVIHLRNDPRHGDVAVALDYRERAPAAVGPDYFEQLQANASRYTGHAVGVPGTIPGLLYALETYGTLDRATVLAPAIQAAYDGFHVDRDLYDSINVLNKHLTQRAEVDAATSAGDRTLQEIYGDDSVIIGDRIVNRRHGEALSAIAEHGLAAYSNGAIGNAIVNAVHAAGGCMTLDDLQGYEVTVRQPLTATRFGYQFVTMPLPSSGGITLLQILGFMEPFQSELRNMDHNDASYVHLVVEAMKHAFADRAAWLGDTDFVDVPVDALLDTEMLAARSRGFDPNRTQPMKAYGTHRQLPDDDGTSHLSVVDAHGNAVACTETINLVFGSRLAVPEFGFCLNNEMDDFLTRRGKANEFGLVQSDRNLPAPGKRPLSSMSPTLVLDDDGNVMFVAGGSGGPRIISGTVQVLLNAILFDAGAQAAVDAPRFHHQWSPDRIRVEPDLTAPATSRGPVLICELRDRGHQLETYLNGIAAVQFIRRVSGGWQAASDARKGGRPAGY